MNEDQKPAKKHKLLKWFAGVTGFLILIAVGAAWYLNNHWKPLLTSLLQNTVTDATDSLYHIKFSNIQVNILSGGVILDSIEIAPDSVIYQKLIRQGDAPENLISLKLAKLSLKNVKPLKVYWKRKLDIKNITIQDPVLSVYYTKLKNQKEKPEDDRSPYERIKSALNELKIGSLFLTDVKFKYVDKSYKKPKITAFDQMNIRLNDILIDSASQYDTTRIFSTKDVIAEISDYTYATSDSMYHIHIKHAYVTTQKKQLIISGVGLIPRYGEIAFSKQFERQQERYKLSFDSVSVNNINFNDLLKSRTILTKNLEIKNGS